MESARIFIAINNEIFVNKLKAFFANYNYEVIGQAKDGSDCLRRVSSLRPDLAVLDYSLPPTSGFEIAKIISEDKLCDVILLANNKQADFINCMKNKTDIVTVIKPINRYSFISTVDLVIKNRKKILKLSKEIYELKSTLKSRKEIEKAKGLLMKHQGLTEDEAFRKIQKESMDRGIPMKDISKAIILAYDI
ncbi:ANTAR domain-containing protein [Herbivorax sp. ANBcel31]|uniref:ANTAR domain-containing response regulator n=1 Tax=Herbivorax sp. ANBcel31 TaxID=3069754 RepID=UPI0027B14614|nr:ANTAR domain-containing protein [Herbivorax sp. ANBcel31]MDQ2086193.1 ANTAR domain-containing protein [Herbivorax sp. ANBcel31]